MMRLCRDFRSGLSHGNVYDMSDAWVRYEKICSDNGAYVLVSVRFQSGRTTFYK
jgi:hypothetical protein